MREFPMIETEHLILRKLSIEDYENYIDYVTDEKISRQFVFNYDRETGRARLEEIVDRYDSEDKPLVWAIALKETNELIGIISVDSVSFKNKNFSLAYGIREKHRGHSYAYQASFALMDYIFENFDMHRLEIAHNLDNIASQRTIEKLGATYEGISRESKLYDNGFVDRKIYSVLKREWEQNKRETLNK